MFTQYYVKKQEFQGSPKESDFEFVEEYMDVSLKKGEILTEALCISVDHFLKEYPIPLNAPIVGFQAARVIESKNGNYPKGSVVVHKVGWKTIEISNEDLVWFRVDNIRPKIDAIHALGEVGIPGLTAYFGLLDICRPQKGETVMTNACAGPVGILVGQIAKLMGCKTVGCCSSAEKVSFAKASGFDQVFNYKKDKPWHSTLQKVAREGIDCFFDNAGGQLSSDIISHMNANGRISCCGFASGMKNLKADSIQPAFVLKHLKMEGFLLSSLAHKHRFPSALKQLAKWLVDNKLHYRTNVYEGFLELPRAFISALKGQNIGKTVVRLPMPTCACRHSGVFAVNRPGTNNNS